VDLQQKGEQSNLNFCRRLLAFRKKYPAMITGGIEFVDCPQGILAFTRSTDDESLLCVYNMRREASYWVPQIDEMKPIGPPLLHAGPLDINKPEQPLPLSAYITKLG
jgi:alpha-glucosidase